MSWKFNTSMRWSGETRWRVCTLRKSREMVVALIIDWKFGAAQARIFADRIDLLCEPMLRAKTADSETMRAILLREMVNARERRLGLMEIKDESTTRCASCSSALSKKATNCNVCGDIVCLRCLRIDGSAEQDDQPTRCSDCEHCALSGKRLLRLQPPGGSDVAKRFALRALFDERAEDDLIDVDGFVEMCRAAARHPLVVDKRSLERELRRLDPGSSSSHLPLDELDLRRAFRYSGGKNKRLGFDAARDLLLDSCVPAWPERALCNAEEEEGDDEENSEDEKNSFSFEEGEDEPDTPLVPGDDDGSLRSPRTSATSTPESTAGISESWWWNVNKPTTSASGPNSRTGWGSLASLDGMARRRVWLELRDDAPRSLHYASDAAGTKKVLVYLASVRQIRRDSPCVVEFRLEPTLADNAASAVRPQKLQQEQKKKNVYLRFETPAATSSWWAAVCRSRQAALTDEQAGSLSADRGDYERSVGAVSGVWMGSLSRIFVCGSECGNNSGTSGGALCVPTPIGAFEGPERPFVTLSNIPEASPDASAASARAESLFRKSSSKRSAAPKKQHKKEEDESARLSEYESEDSDATSGDGEDMLFDDDDDDGKRWLVSSDSLPERGFALAGPEVKAAFQSLVKVIIRPPRATFDERRLGAKDFAIRPPRSLIAAAESSSPTSPQQKKSQERDSSSSQQLLHRPSIASPVVVHRDDFTVSNERGIEVRYSLWTPKQTVDLSGSSTDLPPCVVYVHGNACSRLGSLSLLRPLALGGVCLCAIDCAGSGNSGGEFVSLGHFERDDVAAVVDDLRRRRSVGRVALWGRSMGASTALLYASTRDPDVAAVVADSPYSSLVELCRELVAKARRRGRSSRSSSAGAAGHNQRPGLDDKEDDEARSSPKVGGARGIVLSAITEAALSLVRSSVKHRAGFDIFDVSPISHVANMRHSATPVLFLHGSRDDFVSPNHSKELNNAHGGDATLLLVACDHQATRPASAMREALLFVYDRLAPPKLDRSKYAALLVALAEDGYLGTSESHQNGRPQISVAMRASARKAKQRDEGDDDKASGLDRQRQKEIE